MEEEARATAAKMAVEKRIVGGKASADDWTEEKKTRKGGLAYIRFTIILIFQAVVRETFVDRLLIGNCRIYRGSKDRPRCPQVRRLTIQRHDRHLAVRRSSALASYHVLRDTGITRAESLQTVDIRHKT